MYLSSFYFTTFEEDYKLQRRILTVNLTVAHLDWKFSLFYGTQVSCRYGAKLIKAIKCNGKAQLNLEQAVRVKKRSRGITLLLL
jgi:hypothetical protein